MSSFSAIPRAFIEIWPYSGGSYSITGGQGGILSLDVDKSIRADGPGTFSIQLAPGGPKGVLGPSWQQIIEPYSLVLIGLQRHVHSNIVMVGLVSSVTETQTWSPKGVQRTINVVGADFTLPMVVNNFYLQTFMSLSNNSVNGTNAFLSKIGDGILFGTPAVVGAGWFDRIMAGSDGILSKLSYAYKNSTRLTFSQIMASTFQEYPNNGMQIPHSDYFMSASGSWLSKYKQEVFPAPWYEFFVQSAPLNYYSANMHTPGFAFSMDALPAAAPVTPTMVARVNPLPFTPNDNNGGIPKSMDFTAWDLLPAAILENHGFIQSSISSSEGEVRNYYTIAPLNSTQTYGANNADIVPFTLRHAAWVDFGSVERYGFRSQVSEVHWMIDIDGKAAQQNAAAGNGDSALDQLMATLGLRQTSYYEPIPLMRQATVTQELRPDILAGIRFSYAPYRTGEMWDFYIESVHHSFVFGQGSTTTLALSRGLPHSVYLDEDLMLNLSIGNARVLDGVYTKGLPAGSAGPLQPVNSTAISSGLMGQLAGIFAQAQGGTP